MLGRYSYIYIYIYIYFSCGVGDFFCIYTSVCLPEASSGSTSVHIDGLLTALLCGF